MKRIIAGALGGALALVLTGCTFNIGPQGGIVISKATMTFGRDPLPETFFKFNMTTKIRPKTFAGTATLVWWNKRERRWIGINKVRFGLADVPPKGKTETKRLQGFCLLNVRERVQTSWTATWPSGPPSVDHINLPSNYGKTTGSCGAPILGPPAIRAR